MEKINIKVTLKNDNEKDVLLFDIGEGETIDLNNDDQSKLRELFYKIIKKVINEKKEVKFTLYEEEGYENNLFKNISRDYLLELEKEIAKIYLKINEEGL